MRRPLRVLLNAGIVSLESELYDATSPDGMIAGDFLIHKPGIG